MLGEGRVLLPLALAQMQVLASGSSQVGRLTMSAQGMWLGSSQPLPHSVNPGVVVWPVPWSVALGSSLPIAPFSPCPRSCHPLIPSCPGRPFPLGPFTSTTFTVFSRSLRRTYYVPGALEKKRKLSGSLQAFMVANGPDSSSPFLGSS